MRAHLATDTAGKDRSSHVKRYLATRTLNHARIWAWWSEDIITREDLVDVYRANRGLLKLALGAKVAAMSYLAARKSIQWKMATSGVISWIPHSHSVWIKLIFSKRAKAAGLHAAAIWQRLPTPGKSNCSGPQTRFKMRSLLTCQLSLLDNPGSVAVEAADGGAGRGLETASRLNTQGVS